MNLLAAQRGNRLKRGRCPGLAHSVGYCVAVTSPELSVNPKSRAHSQGDAFDAFRTVGLPTALEGC
jgi:hypothetical protein